MFKSTKPSYARQKTRGSVHYLKSVLKDFVKKKKYALFRNPTATDISLETKKFHYQTNSW